MNFMMEMADLFHEKKKLERMAIIYHEKADKHKKEIDKINLRG